MCVINRREKFMFKIYAHKLCKKFMHKNYNNSCAKTISNTHVQN